MCRRWTTWKDCEHFFFFFLERRVRGGSSPPTSHKSDGDFSYTHGWCRVWQRRKAGCKTGSVFQTHKQAKWVRAILQRWTHACHREADGGLFVLSLETTTRIPHRTPEAGGAGGAGDHRRASSSRRWACGAVVSTAAWKQSEKCWIAGEAAGGGGAIFNDLTSHLQVWISASLCWGTWQRRSKRTSFWVIW